MKKILVVAIDNSDKQVFSDIPLIREEFEAEKTISDAYMYGEITFQQAVKCIIKFELRMYNGEVDPEKLTLKISDLLDLDEDSEMNLYLNLIEKMFY